MGTMPPWLLLWEILCRSPSVTVPGSLASLGRSRSSAWRDGDAGLADAGAGEARGVGMSGRVAGHLAMSVRRSTAAMATVALRVCRRHQVGRSRAGAAPEAARPAGLRPGPVRIRSRHPRSAFPGPERPQGARGEDVGRIPRATALTGPRAASRQMADPARRAITSRWGPGPDPQQRCEPARPARSASPFAAPGPRSGMLPPLSPGTEGGTSPAGRAYRFPPESSPNSDPCLMAGLQVCGAGRTRHQMGRVTDPAQPDTTVERSPSERAMEDRVLETQVARCCCTERVRQLSQACSGAPPQASTSAQQRLLGRPELGLNLRRWAPVTSTSFGVQSHLVTAR